MKSKEFKIVAAINVVVLAILFGTWWINGKDDTWMYVMSAFIALSSFAYIPLAKKGTDQ
jgi:hypothetical protein